MWVGAAAVCWNERGELLMVLQGKPEERKTWSVPSGGTHAGETLEQCCIREVWEETGYRVGIVRKLHEKRGEGFTVHYYEARVTGGYAMINDPDGLIYEIAWKSPEEIGALPLTFEEDREMLLRLVTERQRHG